MRNKRDRAFKRKFYALSGSDAITNMEGAAHSFITPLVPIWMHGDYIYRGHHGVVDFPDQVVDGTKVQTARRVVLSALIQPDFETSQVMYAVSVLGAEPFLGEEIDLATFTVPSVKEKQDDAKRAAYDLRLRKHMVYHLVGSHTLPARSAVTPMTEDEAISYLEDGRSPVNQYVTPRHDADAALSLELLFRSACETLANELSAVEAACPQGYVFTASPPVIFARTLGPTLLNRLFIRALAHIAERNPLPRLRAFAFGDHADPAVVPLVAAALAHLPQVAVLRRADLFPDPPGTYTPPAGAEGALLLIHNNSDGFGQNIEYEAVTSLDGAIGSYSSAAASLRRDRPDLVDHMLPAAARLVI
jgi:hypothetical protein